MLLSLLVLAFPVSAQQCQSLVGDQRFTLVVPYGPGGGFDGYSRLFAAQFEAITDSAMRIRNLPGAGSMIGINAVAEAGPTDLVLGFFNPTILLNDLILGRQSQAMDSLVLLGSLYSDTTTWAKRKDKQVRFESTENRLFALASNSDFTRILLPSYALGWNTHLVRGYSGSSDAMFALLRGDIDYFYSSSVSLANQIRSLDDLTAFLSLTDGPNPVFPEIPYLAGAGGVVEQLVSDQEAEQRFERLEIASLTVALARTYRAITISSNAEPELVNCLLSVVEAVAFSEQIRDAAAAQNLAIQPMDGAALQDEIGQTEVLIESNWDLLQELVARSR